MTDKPVASLIIHNIGCLAEPCADHAVLRGDQLARVRETPNAAIAIVGERVCAAGSDSEVHQAVTTTDDTRFIDAQGALAIPGLVDCHAHPIFAGDRATEFSMRCSGATYEEIHAAGGGIHTTVAATRAALSDGTLRNNVRRHLDAMLAAGTTTAEAKSGYVLEQVGEIASLEIALAEAQHHPVSVIPTLLAAHTVPAEASSADAYIDDVAIPAIDDAVAAGVATAADIFLEAGSFNQEQARRYLQHALTAGLAARIHSDQFTDQGGIDLAIELGARSVDHLEVLTEDDRLNRLAASDVAAVILPTSSLFIQRPWAPARQLVDAGAIVAVASDFNPGSSYGESLTLALSLACIGCGLAPEEAFSAVTRNAAWVLGLDDVGHLRPGARADIVLLDQPDLRHVAYHVGSPGIQLVLTAGEIQWVAGGRVDPAAAGAL